MAVGAGNLPNLPVSMVCALQQSQANQPSRYLKPLTSISPQLAPSSKYAGRCMAAPGAENAPLQFQILSKFENLRQNVLCSGSCRRIQLLP